MHSLKKVAQIYEIWPHIDHSEWSFTNHMHTHDSLEASRKVQREQISILYSGWFRLLKYGNSYRPQYRGKAAQRPNRTSFDSTV